MYLSDQFTSGSLTFTIVNIVVESVWRMCAGARWVVQLVTKFLRSKKKIIIAINLRFENIETFLGCPEIPSFYQSVYLFNLSICLHIIPIYVLIVSIYMPTSYLFLPICLLQYVGSKGYFFYLSLSSGTVSTLSLSLSLSLSL